MKVLISKISSLVKRYIRNCSPFHPTFPHTHAKHLLIKANVGAAIVWYTTIDAIYLVVLPTPLHSPNFQPIPEITWGNFET